MKKLKMNTQLLQKVKQNILDHPDQFYMGGFFSAYTANGKAGGCGTAACIAGWAVYLHRRYSSLARAAEMEGLCDNAKIYLGLSNSKLFYTAEWPEDLRRKWYKAETDQEMAQIAAEAIDDYITTNEWQHVPYP